MIDREVILASIIYNQDNILAANKPAGVTTCGNPAHPEGLKERLFAVTGVNYDPIHQLDIGTTGVNLFSNEWTDKRSLSNQFRRSEVKKIYLAIVDGKTPKQWENAGAIGPKPAQTFFKSLLDLRDESGRTFTLVEARPRTGRTHQIRIHLSRDGFPITGDTYYEGKEADSVSRPFLHAFQLECRFPGTNNPLLLKAPLPEDFIRFMIPRCSEIPGFLM